MNLRRLIAATAAVLTVLSVQGGVITPLAGPLFISLPAVLVAAVGVEAGPSAGMSIGFSAGLLADLGSRHPAGVLALAWLLLGLGCGRLPRGRRRAVTSIVTVAIATGVAGLLTMIVLDLIHAPSGSLTTTLSRAPLSLLGDVVLAAIVVAPVRGVVRTLAVRPIPAAVPRAQVLVDG